MRFQRPCCQENHAQSHHVRFLEYTLQGLSSGAGHSEESTPQIFSDFLSARGKSASLEERHRAWKYANHFFLKQWKVHHQALSTRERIQIVLDRLKIACTWRELRAFSDAYEDLTLMAPPRLIRGVRVTLPTLAKKYRLAIICDTGITSGRVLRRLPAQDGLLSHFNYCVFSDEVGCTKPHIDNFHAALRKLRVKPHEAVHIGDLIRTDIRGALDAGMQALLFTGITQYTDRQRRREAEGISVVHDFRRIPRVILALDNSRES